MGIFVLMLFQKPLEMPKIYISSSITLPDFSYWQVNQNLRI